MCAGKGVGEGASEVVGARKLLAKGKCELKWEKNMLGFVGRSWWELRRCKWQLMSRSLGNKGMRLQLEQALLLRLKQIEMGIPYEALTWEVHWQWVLKVKTMN